ncbi:MAG: M24 family metallopeptidase, partial [Janthinobacterium sp.]
MSTIRINTAADIEGMRIAGKLGAEVLDYITPFVKVGVTTGELDRLCHEYMVNVQGTIPAPLNYCPPGYTPYPKAICTSVNDVICHGIPSEAKVLKDGDIINIDVTVIKDGWHGDTSRMYYVGTPSVMAKRLVETTKEAM